MLHSCFKTVRVKLSLLVAFLLVSSLVVATDAEREQRWIDQTVDSIFDGEAVYLFAENHRFLGIYTEAPDESTRGVIVLHGTGFHPDWAQVVHPVRVEMPAHGWSTLSIQLPILERSAAYEDYVTLYPEVPPRIDAAVEFLLDKGIDDISIIAHSQGATMAAYYLANSDHQIKAFVAIGMSAQHTQKTVNSAESLKRISIPVLDIFGSKDFPAVLATIDQRGRGAAHNQGYQQQVIRQAYHFFDDFEDELLDALLSWLNRTR